MAEDHPAMELSVHLEARLVSQPDRIFFSILYRRLLKHGIFTSQDDLAQQMLA